MVTKKKAERTYTGEEVWEIMRVYMKVHASHGEVCPTGTEQCYACEQLEPFWADDE